MSFIRVLETPCSLYSYRCSEHSLNLAVRHFVDTLSPTTFSKLKKQKCAHGVAEGPSASHSEDEVEDVEGEGVEDKADDTREFEEENDVLPDDEELDAFELGSSDDFSTADAVGKVLGIITQVRLSPAWQYPKIPHTDVELFPASFLSSGYTLFP
jgi:hypothetical protein